MKVSQAIEILQDLMDESGGDPEVFISKGDFSQQAVAIDPYIFCPYLHSRWRKCLNPNCNAEKKEGVLIV